MVPLIRRSAVVGLVVALVVVGFAPAQNSMRKIRKRPSALANQVGTAVQWRQDVEAALAESRKSGKPVFWYVPTVSGSPMDRKPEIDRYMMAGPFSWPETIALLNSEFIPVRARAGGARAAKYRLQRERFIEPGYVVLDGDGKERRRMDRLTTFHPQWFLTPLAELVGKKIPAPEKTAAHAGFLEGVSLFHSGQSDAALALWRKIGTEHPKDPMGWKSMAEAEGHGPFRFGFEVFGELPQKVFVASPESSRAPEGAYSPEAARKRSLDFLCRMQLSNGGWEDSRYDFGGTDSLPNVYVACTALIAEALLEELHAKPVVGDVGRMENALASAVGYLLDESRLNYQDRDELIWAQIYRINFFSRYMELRGKREQPAIKREQLVRIVAKVFEMQPGSGSWYHEYQNPFVTAEVLVALHHAERAGIELDEAKVARGARALAMCRTRDGAYSYSFSRRPRSSRLRAAGRMPLCELALLRHGKSDQERLSGALRAALKHHDVMASVRKYDDHARETYGGFFFWFDMLGRTRALLALADDGERKKLRETQRKWIESLPEFDGCFIDSHELGRTYGTAMALLCLAQLRR